MEEGPADLKVTSFRKEGQSSHQLKMKASASYNCSSTWLYELGRELGEKKGHTCCSDVCWLCIQGEIEILA